MYWKTEEGQPPSPLGPLFAVATAEGYTAKLRATHPSTAIYFQALKGQTDKAPGGAKEYMVDGKMSGGFALVAYPAEYGNSGVMTFIINQDGVLLQKDLGKSTTETARAMTLFDPDPSWVIVLPVDQNPHARREARSTGFSLVYLLQRKQTSPSSPARPQSPSAFLTLQSRDGRAQ